MNSTLSNITHFIIPFRFDEDSNALEYPFFLASSWSEVEDVFIFMNLTLDYDASLPSPDSNNLHRFEILGLDSETDTNRASNPRTLQKSKDLNPSEVIDLPVSTDASTIQVANSIATVIIPVYHLVHRCYKPVPDEVKKVFENPKYLFCGLGTEKDLSPLRKYGINIRTDRVYEFDKLLSSWNLRGGLEEATYMFGKGFDLYLRKSIQTQTRMPSNVDDSVSTQGSDYFQLDLSVGWKTDDAVFSSWDADPENISDEDGVAGEWTRTMVLYAGIDALASYAISVNLLPLYVDMKSAGGIRKNGVDLDCKECAYFVDWEIRSTVADQDDCSSDRKIFPSTRLSSSFPRNLLFAPFHIRARLSLPELLLQTFDLIRSEINRSGQSQEYTRLCKKIESLKWLKAFHGFERKQISLSLIKCLYVLDCIHLSQSDSQSQETSIEAEVYDKNTIWLLDQDSFIGREISLTSSPDVSRFENFKITFTVLPLSPTLPILLLRVLPTFPSPISYDNVIQYLTWFHHELALLDSNTAYAKAEEWVLEMECLEWLIFQVQPITNVKVLVKIIPPRDLLDDYEDEMVMMGRKKRKLIPKRIRKVEVVSADSSKQEPASASETNGAAEDDDTAEPGVDDFEAIRVFLVEYGILSVWLESMADSILEASASVNQIVHLDKANLTTELEYKASLFYVAQSCTRILESFSMQPIVARSQTIKDIINANSDQLKSSIQVTPKQTLSVALNSAEIAFESQWNLLSESDISCLEDLVLGSMEKRKPLSKRLLSLVTISSSIENASILLQFPSLITRLDIVARIFKRLLQQDKIIVERDSNQKITNILVPLERHSMNFTPISLSEFSLSPIFSPTAQEHFYYEKLWTLFTSVVNFTSKTSGSSFELFKLTADSKTSLRKTCRYNTLLNHITHSSTYVISSFEYLPDRHRFAEWHISSWVQLNWCRLEWNECDILNQDNWMVVVTIDTNTGNHQDDISNTADKIQNELKTPLKSPFKELHQHRQTLIDEMKSVFDDYICTISSPPPASLPSTTITTTQLQPLASSLHSTLHSLLSRPRPPNTQQPYKTKSLSNIIHTLRYFNTLLLSLIQNEVDKWVICEMVVWLEWSKGWLELGMFGKDPFGNVGGAENGNNNGNAHRKEKKVKKGKLKVVLKS